MKNVKSHDDKVELSPDIFLHEPVSVGLKKLGMPVNLEVMQSRHITPKGILIEIHPPCIDLSVFQLRNKIEVTFQLTGHPLPFSLSGELTRIIATAMGPAGLVFSLLVVRFHSLDARIKDILEAHQVAAQAVIGQPRTERVRVRFPVEARGIDVLSPLIAYDLSMSGMYVGTEAKFQQGRTLAFACHLPFQQRPTPAKGKIIWAGQKLLVGHQAPLQGFGIQFVEISEKAKENLALYYSRFLIQL